jgi:outer membrane receptor protein involved in Fe transport
MRKEIQKFLNIHKAEYMRKILLFNFLFLLLIASENFAGTTGKISGVVTDQATGAPLIGANVLIEGTSTGTATDADGYYSMINISPGRYNLIFQFIGYAKVRIENVEVSVDRTTKADAVLSSESVSLDEVLVKAERPAVQKDRTYSASVVNSDAIENMPVTTMQEVIQLQPGVVAADGQLHFRGGRGREVAYLIDGIPVSNSYNQDGGINVSVENSMIEELEVISGTFNAEYGSAQSGVINIITKGPEEKFSGSIKTYAGEWLSSRSDVFIGIDDFNPLAEKDIQLNLSGPVISDQLSFFVSGRYNNSQSYQWYEKRFNTIDGWRIAAYQKWYEGHNSGDISGTQAIPIPDELSTGDGSEGPLQHYKSYSFSGKLNYFPLSQFRIGYQFYGSWGETKGGDDSRRYQPDETTTSLGWSQHHFLTIKHSPSANLFYNLGFSYQHNDGESYYRKDNKVAEYPGDDGIQPISSSTDGFSLGTTPGFYTDADSKNFRDLILVNGDIDWQIDKYNFIKAGFEFKKHKINTYSWGYVETKEWENKKWPSVDDIDPAVYEFEEYWSALVNYWKNWNDIYGTTKYRKYDESEYTLWRDYTIEPVEAAVYLQDKIEFGEIIVNAGLRLDVFYPNEKYPVNKKAESYLLGTASNQAEASTKYQLSPRLGVSFPVSDGGVFHAAYGHFFQMPSFEYMYNRPLYAFTSLQLDGVRLGNADLKAERTIAYEIGLQQQIASDLAVDVTAYYKDIRDLLGIEKVTTVDAIGYERYINRDYGNTKGITVGLRKTGMGFITGAINYTYSYANGSSSDPNTLQVIETATQIGGEPVQFIDRKILPLNWDQRHTLNVIINFSKINDWSIGIISSLSSGLPYSPEFIERYDLSEREYKNSAERPTRWSVDLKAKKNFTLGSLQYVLFLKVDNLFDHLNENTVYTSTGTAEYIARIPSTEELEKERLAQQGLFTLGEIDNHPDWYSSPRKIELGLEIHF